MLKDITRWTFKWFVALIFPKKKNNTTAEVVYKDELTTAFVLWNVALK